MPHQSNYEKSTVQGVYRDQAPYLGEAYDKKQGYDAECRKSWTCSCTTLIFIKQQEEGILKGNLPSILIEENGRNIAPFVEFKSITGFEADRHLGQ